MAGTHDTEAFTVVELLVALVVTSVILSAVAALAFAMSTAGHVGEDMALSQAQVRQASLRLREIMGHARLVCAAPGDDLALWSGDDNGNDAIDVNEVIYVERGAEQAMLRLCRFETTGSHVVTLSDLANSNTKSLLTSSYQAQFTPLMPDCGNVSFTCHRDDPADPLTKTQHVTISFELTEGNGVHRYEIDAALRAWAGHLLSADGTALVSDDD